MTSGNVNYLNLILTNCLHVLKYDIKSPKHVQVLHVNKSGGLTSARLREDRRTPHNQVKLSHGSSRERKRGGSALYPQLSTHFPQHSALRQCPHPCLHLPVKYGRTLLAPESLSPGSLAQKVELYAMYLPFKVGLELAPRVP